MTRRARTTVALGLVAVVVLIVAVVGLARPDRALRIATGFVSYTVCAETFVSGLDPDQVYAETVKPVPGIALLDWALRRHVDRERREVRTAVLGAFENRAVYRKRRGCIPVHGPEPTDITMPEKAGADAPGVGSLEDIAAPATVEPTDERLKAALDRAFAEPDRPPYRWTKAVIVVHDGRIVAERYAPGYRLDTPLLGYSLTKSLVNALVGILVRRGQLSVGEPAPVPAWRNPSDPRHAITIDELLRMTSGLALGNSLEERNKAWDPSARMLFLERDMAGFAERVALATPPGSRWEYADGNTLILSRIIRDAVGGRAEDVLAFAERELFVPLGMRNVTLPFDATGTPIGSSAMLAPARDWARFSLLYLNDGVVGGRRILPEGWVRYSSSPTPGAVVGYGAGLWTNHGSSRGAERRVGWGMPREAFFGAGLLGQYLVVVPSARLVVARFGVTHGPRGDIEGTSRLVADVLASLAPRSR